MCIQQGEKGEFGDVAIKYQECTCTLDVLSQWEWYHRNYVCTWK